MTKLKGFGAAALALTAWAGALAGTAQAQGRPADEFGDAPVARADLQARVTAEFGKLDANHDGFVSPDEMPANAPAAPPGPRRDPADTNGDGKLSQAEFVGAALGRFDMGDTNHDGQLTKAEREAAHKAMTGRMGNRDGGMGGGPMGDGPGGGGPDGGPGGGGPN